MHCDFIHLRSQSSYSLLESALTIDKIIELAVANHMPALCLSDRGNLFGLLEFALGCSKAGVQPIHGIILNVIIPDITTDSKIIHPANNFAEILLIAKDPAGYQNLLKLSSYVFVKNDRKICNHITIADLIDHQQGIIALSSYTDGIIGKFLLAKNQPQAVFWAHKLQDIFADRFYCEIMRHSLAREQLIESAYLEIAVDLNIPLVATNQVLFSDVSRHDDHDVLLCLLEGVTKGVKDRRRVSNQCYFKSSSQMVQLFSDLPEALENTIALAQRCYVMAVPHPPMLPNFVSQVSEDEQIRQDAELGLDGKLAAKFKFENTPLAEQVQITEQYLERLNYELAVICKMHFSGYFLIVSDFIKWSKEQGISVGPGRGSGAGSVVAWSLLITDLDPIKFGLLFERFLNSERISMPDFDIDFCQERREEVIDYVRAKYGDNRVGQIITFGKMQAKAVIKDVSRVLSLPYNYANYLTELVPFNAVNPVTLEQAIHEVAELKSAASGQGLYDMRGEVTLIQQVLSTALALEGLHRHASIHAAGLVISGRDLVEIVPVYKSLNSPMLVVQYSMKYAELAGLIKFDFLGLQTLTVITKCLKLLLEQNIKIDFSSNLFDDALTYQMLSTGQSTGVFQFESAGMKDTLRQLKPDCLGDLIALGALYRPGPMENIPVYIACKHGKQQPDYLHPLLESILQETYGVIIYQEQVIEIAKILANYTLGTADLLRRAMGKKIKSEMAAQEQQFINGAKANGVTYEQAKSIFTTVAKFAGYGFNKAHASAYGVISYQTAYLKANFPAEFLVSCLNLEINNNDKINVFIQEARQSNITIMPPDINYSTGYFSVQDQPQKTIIYGLGAIKNVTVAFAKLVETERASNGDFRNIINFVERLPHKAVNRRLLENLIKAGCFDNCHQNRQQLLLSVEKLMAYAASYHQEAGSNQFSLIKVNTISQAILVSADHAALLNDTALGLQEFEVLGLFINKHPLTEYQNLLAKLNMINSRSLKHDLPPGLSIIKIAGIIQKKEARMSARGRFITLQLSDQFGIFEVTIFSEELLKNYVHLLNVETLVVVQCEAARDQGGVRLVAKSFSGLSDMIRDTKFNLKLYPKNLAELQIIVDLLKLRTGSLSSNNTSVVLFIPVNPQFTAKIELLMYFYLEILDLETLKKFSPELG